MNARMCVGWAMVVAGVALAMLCASVLGDALGPLTVLPIGVAVSLLLGGVAMTQEPHDGR